jgi:hypothetical protein
MLVMSASNLWWIYSVERIRSAGFPHWTNVVAGAVLKVAFKIEGITVDGAWSGEHVKQPKAIAGVVPEKRRPRG